MSQSKCFLELYTKFLIANHNRYSGVELSKTSNGRLSHDSVSRWLSEKEGEECIPCDYRIYQSEKKGVKTKNQHFRDMLMISKKRGFNPLYVLADCWYGSVENMKYIEKQGWKFIMGAKENRQVSITKNIYVSIANP